MADLWLPPSMKEKDETPRFGCSLCGSQFWRVEPYERHIGKCAESNEEKIATADRPHQRLGEGDTAKEDWVRDNRQEILERRKFIYGPKEKWLD